MTEIERAREQMKSDQDARAAEHEARMAEHEARMARLERADQVEQRKLEEMRRQTREIIAEIARLDARREKEGKVLVEALKGMRGRVSRLERK